MPPGSLPAPLGKAGALEELRELLTNTPAAVTSYHDELAVERATSNLSHRTQRAVSLLGLLEQLDQDERALDPHEVDAWFSDHTPVLSPPRLGDVCFAAAFELRRALTELHAAASTEERVLAVESGHRKLWRAARAVLRTQNPESRPHDYPEESEEEHLASGLAARRLYADFRRALRRPEGPSAEQVLSAMRYASSALSTIVAAPEYASLRASDRAIVRRLHARILTWGRHDRAADVGLQVLEDVWTAADLLRGINRRQEVQEHDRALIAELLAGVVPDGDGFMAASAALYGLDDGLDHLLLEVKRGGDSESASVRARAILFRFV